MTANWALVADIAVPVVTLVLGIFLDRVFERRPRLVTYLIHTSSHTVHEPGGERVLHVGTHSVVIKNSGRKPNINVRVPHNFLPDFNIWPEIEHRVVNLSGGGREIVIPTLVPREEIRISYLYLLPTNWAMINGPIKSDEGFARVLTVLPTQQNPRWARLTASVLTLVGLVAVLYLAWTAIESFLRAD